jgi:hypothetical protein
MGFKWTFFHCIRKSSIVVGGFLGLVVDQLGASRLVIHGHLWLLIADFYCNVYFFSTLYVYCHYHKYTG